MTNHKPSLSAMHQRFKTVTATASAPTPASVAARSWFEPALIEILLRPAPAGAARDEHVRKEHELGSVFMRLTVLEAWKLHKRLSIPAKDDALATAFGRLIEERRARLLAFLGDARRRAALATAA